MPQLSSSLAAALAGKIPEMMPVIVENPKPAKMIQRLHPNGASAK